MSTKSLFLEDTDSSIQKVNEQATKRKRDNYHKHQQILRERLNKEAVITVEAIKPDENARSTEIYKKTPK